MASFTTSPTRAFDFSNFEIEDLIGPYLFVANAMTWRTGPSALDPGTHVDVQGVGFTYSGGSLTGGTINTITSTVAGSFDFQIDGLALPADTFNAYRWAGASEGFLTLIFGGDDTITGSNLDDRLLGYAGNDHLVGNKGDDVLDGGAGDDTLTGGQGNDTYVIDSIADAIQESGGSTDDQVWATVDVDLNQKAFDGIEHASVEGAANLSIIGDTGWNILNGNKGNNTLSGKTGDDNLSGRDGNDVLDGGFGKDHMQGGAGDDTYTVDNAGDQISENGPFGGDAGGLDTVISSLTSFTLSAYFENLTLTGAALNGTGNALGNTLIGNANANVLDGLGGIDTMIGGDGNDKYTVNNAKDVVVETSTGGTGDEVHSTTLAYTLPDYVERLYLDGSSGINGTGNALNNIMFGNSGSNKLDGGDGNDHMVGGSGADTLIGGAGNDYLRGDAGNDTIDTSFGDDTVAMVSKLDGFDVVLGFDGDATGGQDRLDLAFYLESLGIDPEDRAGRVGIEDKGDVVNVWIDKNDDGFLDTKVAELHTADTITVAGDLNLIAIV